MKLLLALALGSILHPALELRDVDGVIRTPLKVEAGRFQATGTWNWQ